MGHLVKDEALKLTRALPAAASSQVDSASSIDTGNTSGSDFVKDCELLISAPALNATILPNTRTMSYSIIHSDSASLSGATVLYGNVLVQTGAGGVGAAAATARARLPTNVKRYVGLRIDSGASTTDASATSSTLEVLV